MTMIHCWSWPRCRGGCGCGLRCGCCTCQPWWQDLNNEQYLVDKISNDNKDVGVVVVVNIQRFGSESGSDLKTNKFHFFLHFLVEGPTVAALRDNNYIQANINIILPFLYCRKNHTWPCCTWLYLRISPCCQRPGPRPSCLWCTRWRTRRQTNPKHILFEYK